MSTNLLKNPKILFVASSDKEAISAKTNLSDRYGNYDPENANVIVALGGDGFMLKTLHEHIDSNIPVYGMNCGSVGFLMNEYSADDLPQRLQKASEIEFHPLVMEATDSQGQLRTAVAINEVSLFRRSSQAAKLCISIDGKIRLEELMCDGILLATPAGSTAYNLSAHGPILPKAANLLALTPISAYRPRRWRGALLPNHVLVTIEILNSEKRPVNAVADNYEINDVKKVDIKENKTSKSLALFDHEHGLEERILKEMFQF